MSDIMQPGARGASLYRQVAMVHATTATAAPASGMSMLMHVVDISCAAMQNHNCWQLWSKLKDTADHHLSPCDCTQQQHIQTSGCH
jgi:hypothetical protein